MSQSDNTEHIVRISMGKDSLKMLDVMWTRGLRMDKITTTDVWATDTIPAWLPPMQEFRDRMDQWIWERYHIECEHLCARNRDGSKKTYEQMFYHVPNRRSKRSSRERPEAAPGWRVQGTITGFPPNTGYNYCQKLKIVQDRHQGQAPRLPGLALQLAQETQDRLCQNPFPNERPTRRKKRNIVEYIGIAADEPDRFGQLNDRKRAPLVEFDIDEDLCGLYCQYNNILAPSYETSCRDGCWFCHNQGVDQLRELWRNWPEYWTLLMKWDLDSPVSFKADGHTVHDFDRRFQMEEDGVVPMDNTFRWYAVENNISVFDLLRREYGTVNI